MVDPRVDILRADWSPFSAPNWTLPLLTSLTDWRGRLKEIKAEYRRRSVETNEMPPWIVFAADFPGLNLKTFIQKDVDRVRSGKYRLPHCLKKTPDSLLQYRAISQEKACAPPS